MHAKTIAQTYRKLLVCERLYSRGNISPSLLCRASKFKFKRRRKKNNSR